MRYQLMIGIAAAFMAAMPANGQSLNDALHAGDKLRMNVSNNGRYIVTLEEIGADSMTVSSETGRFRIATSTTQEIYVSRGTRRHTLLGLGIGVLGGGVALGLETRRENQNEPPCPTTDWDGLFCNMFKMSDSDATKFGAAFGAAAGGALGAIIGTFIKTDVWERVRR